MGSGVDNTYIKLFRSLLAWEWYKDTNTTRVFLHILLKANYKPSQYKGYTIAAGECVFGYNAWAKELGLSVRQVRTAIEHLKSTNEITMTSTNKFSVVTVVNWERWQVYDGDTDKQIDNQDDSQATSKRQATDKQPTTSKESKKVRREEYINNQSINNNNNARAQGPYEDPVTGRIRFNCN